MKKKKTIEHLSNNISPKEHMLNVQSIENDVKKVKLRNMCLILGIIFVGGLLGVISFLRQEVNKDYIEGNILKIARIGEATVGNVWKNDSFIGQLTFRSLFMTEANFTDIKPELAEKYEVSEDGLTYVITLKDELKWSDGVLLTPEDIVFSIESFLLCKDTNETILIAFNKILGAEEWKNGETTSLEGLSINGNGFLSFYARV